MDPKQIISRYANANDTEIILEVYNHLATQYDLTFDLDSDFDLSHFQCFHANHINDIGPVLSMQKNGKRSHVAFTEVTAAVGKGSSLVYQVWGIVQLKKSYGHIFIRHETMLDKIHDLINRIDIDFDDDTEFSKRFLVVSNDETEARLLLNDTVRGHIKNIGTREIMIEIIGNQLIIGNEKNISIETASEICKFMNNIANQLN